MVDGLDEADAPHLKQVVQIFPAVYEPLHHAEHQPQIPVDELLPGFLVPLPHPFQKGGLFLSLSTGSRDVSMPQISTLFIMVRSSPYPRLRADRSMDGFPAG